ncbi:MAG: acyltransferase [Desulfobacteraceae bacterium]|nr:acyltransferase [Desulfobacteraceae bacterium]MBC2720374.1 acyltransferase [Desulfobacteraceae bacterium]
MASKTLALFKIIKAIAHLSQTANHILALLKGFYYKFKYGLFNKRVAFGKRLLIRGPLKISGPGKVVIGDNVSIDGSGHPVTPFTHHKDAVISIGSNSFVNGTRFGCQKQIIVGDYAILGDARIMDTDFHSIYPNRWSSDAIVESKPIIIGKNVWIGAASAILKGVTIGNNSVIGFGAVVSKNVPPNCVVAGNPAKPVKNLVENDR